jgi:lambda repressor-like predicted transcriptional regulator
MAIDPKKVPSNVFERSQWIQVELRKRGTNLRRLAHDNSLGATTLYSALRLPSLPSEQVIADALGTTPAVLFPDRYTPAGDRLHQVRNRAVA